MGMGKEHCVYFAGASILIGMIAGIILEGTFGGIPTCVVWLLIEAFLYFIVRKCNGEVADRSGKYLVYGAFLSVALTISNNRLMVMTDFFGVLILNSLFLYHQYESDENWGFLKVFRKLVDAFFEPFSRLGRIFGDLRLVFETGKINKVYLSIGLGIIIVIPLVIVIGSLLMSADALFSQVVESMFGWMNLEVFFEFNLWRMIKFVAITCFVYGFLVYMLEENSVREELPVKKYQPVTAVVVYGCLMVLYAFFCVVQLGYLFQIDNREYIYANGAREGFFQLVFVAFFNLVLVINGIHHIHKNRALNNIMLVMSVCTYGMMVSAAVKMFLYVRAYHLTVLRFMVCWAIVVIAIVFGGVIRNIYDEDFKLYQYAFHTFTILFIILSLLRPDFIVADYNLNIAKNGTDFRYMRRDLSIDILPAVLKAEDRYGGEAEYQRLLDSLAEELADEREDQFVRFGISELVGNWQVRFYGDIFK